MGLNGVFLNENKTNLWVFSNIQGSFWLFLDGSKFSARELWLASRAGSSWASKILARLGSSYEKWARADPYY